MEFVTNQYDGLYKVDLEIQVFKIYLTNLKQFEVFCKPEVLTVRIKIWFTTPTAIENTFLLLFFVMWKRTFSARNGIFLKFDKAVMNTQIRSRPRSIVHKVGIHATFRGLLTMCRPLYSMA
jgi:hypothetical protein